MFSVSISVPMLTFGSRLISSFRLYVIFIRLSRGTVLSVDCRNLRLFGVDVAIVICCFRLTQDSKFIQID